MRKELFLRIINALENHSVYFTERVDAVGRSSLTPLQKCVAAIRLLAYGVAGDIVDEYVRISGYTTIQCLKKFCKCVIAIFEPEYLRRPTVDDIQPLLQIGEARGFPGSNNNINVLDRSPIFDELLEGRGPDIQYTVNGSMYNIGYYLADGIYPEWPVFVKSIPRANMLLEKRKLFSQYQEGARKDIERAFGVLQKRFAIVCNPVRLRDKTEVGDIMKACIILHNMIIEDERDDNGITPTVQYTVSRNQNESPQLRTGLHRSY
ncbi:uncharacterized protein LOC104882934 [Beta vulgaris subsp. vulgaris]|uniref:uncharacterized protein LOC104882934 n=1 Tax=Beta vulgaris subsp. vulgaris TaxID=3555 RepID=UPI00053F7202|nr:uncharacterized protein LOC104882934 [Beta vulgaris subsp. vulgaris]